MNGSQVNNGEMLSNFVDKSPMIQVRGTKKEIEAFEITPRGNQKRNIA